MSFCAKSSSQTSVGNISVSTIVQSNFEIKKQHLEKAVCGPFSFIQQAAYAPSTSPACRFSGVGKTLNLRKNVFTVRISF
jgi:hypothetical protein